MGLLRFHSSSMFQGRKMSKLQCQYVQMIPTSRWHASLTRTICSLTQCVNSVFGSAHSTTWSRTPTESWNVCSRCLLASILYLQLGEICTGESADYANWAYRLRDSDPPMGATAWGDGQAVSRPTAQMIDSWSPKKACEGIFKGER